MNHFQGIRCAPLKGFTDALFQRIHKKHYSGITRYMAPFLLSSGDEKGWKGAYCQYRKKSLGFPDTIPQILVSDRLEEITLYIRLFKENGFPEVNLNSGCSAGCVMKKNKGAAMLAQPELLRRILDRVCLEFPDYLSLKLRLGIADSSDILHLIPVFNQYPLRSLIVHPRTSEQKYNGNPDWGLFNQTVSDLKIPIFYSGDIFSLEDYRILEKRCAFAGLLLGRGLLGNPALGEEIIRGDELPHEERIERFAAFYNEFAAALVDEMGKRAFYRLKGWWFYFSFHFGKERKQYLNSIYGLSDLAKIGSWEDLMGEIHGCANH